ncbi:hypothetical protein [Lysinibacillus xylanilyticus]|uniref:hypothetical protein n=1 Tax=Lysinibacillus xylanilyticus TaxID=582475 RepID=UPI0036DEFE44
MIDFVYQNDLNLIYITSDGKTVGKIYYNRPETEHLVNRVKTYEERVLVESLNTEGLAVHMRFIRIGEEFRGQGFFREALEKFEALFIDYEFEFVSLLAPHELVEFYESVGYVNLGWLGSIKQYLMKKDLNLELRRNNYN